MERLAGQLPDIHLHIATGPAGSPSADGGHPADAVAGAGPGQARGAVRVYLGYAAGCGVTTAMLEEAGRRRSRGSDVVVAAVDCRGREGVSAALDGLELVGDGRTLDIEAVLARRPEVACIDDLSAVEASGESRFAAARRLAEAGVTVVATVLLESLHGRDGAAPGGPLDEAAVLAFADEIELVDAPPSVLADRVRRGELVPAAGIEEALQADYAPETLAALREQAFTIVAEHADRQLAAYQRGAITASSAAASGTAANTSRSTAASSTAANNTVSSSTVASSEARPSILGCAAPQPGMEPLIRRSAALAAQLAGDFRVATVLPSPPAADLDQMLADYAALTAQLGGQFAVLTGDPAAELTAFAHQHQVTEMLLAREGRPLGGRHRVLRELTQRASPAEVHVLPAAAHPLHTTADPAPQP